MALPIRAVAPARIASDRPPAKVIEAEPTIAAKSLAGLRVIVVDDEPDARDLVQTALEGAVPKSRALPPRVMPSKRSDSSVLMCS